MAGLTAIEGKDDILETLYNEQTLEVGLFTNTSGLTANSVLADITQPSAAGGYAVKTLAPASWTITNGSATHPNQLFQAVGAAFSAPIYGYFIKTTSGRIVLRHFEVDTAAPVIVSDGQTYEVDLSSVI